MKTIRHVHTAVADTYTYTHNNAVVAHLPFFTIPISTACPGALPSEKRVDCKACYATATAVAAHPLRNSGIFWGGAQ